MSSTPTMPLVLYILFALSFVPIVMAATGVVLRIREFGHLDNHHPRLQQAQMKGVGARINSAQANSWESLLVFLLVVFVAYAAGLPLAQLDTVAIVFLCLRIAYCGFYIANLAWLRTGTFAAGMFCCVYIFYLAASYANSPL